MTTIKRVDKWNLGSFQDAYPEAVIAFAAVTLVEGGIGLGIAVYGEAGYYPVGAGLAFGETHDEMADYADELNKDLLGLDDRAAAKIVLSSMSDRAHKPANLRANPLNGGG